MKRLRLGKRGRTKGMLRIDVAGKTLSIEWEHQTLDDGVLPPGTTCLIYDDDQPRSAEPIAEGCSWLHPSDRFDKETGRKVSLGKALGKLFPGAAGFASRKKVWEAYFGRKGSKPLSALMSGRTYYAPPPMQPLPPAKDVPPWAQLADDFWVPGDRGVFFCNCTKMSSPPPPCHLHPIRRSR